MARPPLTLEYVRYCSPEAPNEQIVPPKEDESTNIIEPGYAVIVDDASVGTYDGGALSSPAEAALIKQMLLAPGSWWFEGVATTASPHRATPLLGLTPPRLILRPGERLGARVPTTGSFYVMYTGVKVPIAWLPLVAYGVDVPDPPEPPPPLTAVSILPHAATLGQPTTFTATAAGGTQPYQFKWWLFDGTTWLLMQNWGAGTMTWTPLALNPNWRVGVWVRSAGETADTNAVNLSVAVTVA